MSDINVIPYKNNTLSTSVFIQVPSTVADLVAQFGESAVWKACIRQVCYGPWNTTFRPLVAERLEKMFPEFPRKELSRRTNKAGEEVVSYESEQSYVTRLLADGGLEENVLATLAQEVANTVPFELVDSQTTKKPDAAYMAKARQILAFVENGTTTEEKFSANFAASNPGFTIASVGGFNEEGIARALEINQRRLESVIPSDLLG
jgi:hypothetical protein